MGTKSKKDTWISTKAAGIEIDRTARTIQEYCKPGHPYFLETERFGRYYMIRLTVWEEWKARHFTKAA